MLQVSCTVKCSFAVGLYDLLGKKLRDVGESEVGASQTWEQKVSLDGLAAGVFLLAVTTDRGEQLVRQIVKGM